MRVVESDLLPPGETLVDYGCGNKPYADLFRSKFTHYMGADLPGNAHAELIVGAEGQLPVDDESVDCVFSSQVLEHVADPRIYLGEAHRILRPGGSLVLSTHGVWPYHPDPTDHWRWTIAGLQLELRRAMQALLTQAKQEFLELRMQLMKSDETDSLDKLGQRVLRDCYFEIAHTYYALSSYDKAIIAYSGAANRYPQDPQVLLAYVQMTNCYDRLGKPDEARSMLAQAKVILKQMTDEIFQPNATNMTRQEWDRWLDWARQLHQPIATQETASP